MGDHYTLVQRGSMDINSPAGAAAMSARLQKEYLWPAEATKPIEATLDDLYATCDLFEKHYRPGFHDPVTADIPTLVFSGRLDTQTAASWVAETARQPDPRPVGRLPRDRARRPGLLAMHPEFREAWRPDRIVRYCGA